MMFADFVRKVKSAVLTCYIVVLAKMHVNAYHSFGLVSIWPFSKHVSKLLGRKAIVRIVRVAESNVAGIECCKRYPSIDILCLNSFKYFWNSVDE